jgi:hypothetical protein
MTDPDGTFVSPIGPNSKPYFFIGGCDNGREAAQNDGCTEKLNVPGFHEGETLAKAFELGAQEMADIQFLKVQISLLNEIRAVILQHGGLPFRGFKT